MPVNYSFSMHSRGLYSSNHVPKVTSLLLQACVIVDGPSSLKGFDHHVKNDHNMWNYIYFSIYLDHIDTSDHNAIEGYVYEMVSTFKSCEDIINPTYYPPRYDNKSWSSFLCWQHWHWVRNRRMKLPVA